MVTVQLTVLRPLFNSIWLNLTAYAFPLWMQGMLVVVAITVYLNSAFLMCF